MGTTGNPLDRREPRENGGEELELKPGLGTEHAETGPGLNHPPQQQAGLALHRSGWGSRGGDQLAGHSQT